MIFELWDGLDTYNICIWIKYDHPLLGSLDINRYERAWKQIWSHTLEAQVGTKERMSSGHWVSRSPTQSRISPCPGWLSALPKPLLCRFDWRVEEKRALAGLRQSLGYRHRYRHRGDNNLPLRRNSCPSPRHAPPAWFLSKILINSNLYFHTALAVWICKCLFNAPETPSTLSKHMAL